MTTGRNLTITLFASSALLVSCDDAAPIALPDAGMQKLYGEECAGSMECKSGFCIEGLCSAECAPDDVSSCVNHDAMCVAYATVPGACRGGPLGLGDDVSHNRVMNVSQRLSQPLGVGDADLFKLKTDPAGGALWLEVTPADGLDVAIDVYTDRGEYWGAYDGEGVDGIERGELTPAVPAPGVFAVVRHVAGEGGEITVGWACSLHGCE